MFVVQWSLCVEDSDKLKKIHEILHIEKDGLQAFFVVFHSHPQSWDWNVMQYYESQFQVLLQTTLWLGLKKSMF